MSDNGELTPKQQAIQDGKTCGYCKYKFPQSKLLVVPLMEPPKAIAQRPSQPELVAFVICTNPASETFQQVGTIQASCTHFESAPVVETPPATEVPKKIADRMKNSG